MASTWEPFRSTSLPCPLDDDAVPTEPDHTIAALYHSRPNNSNLIGNYPGGLWTDRDDGRSELGFVSVKNGYSRGKQMWRQLKLRKQIQLTNRYKYFRTNLDRYDFACANREMREWLRHMRVRLADALWARLAERLEQEETKLSAHLTTEIGAFQEKWSTKNNLKAFDHIQWSQWRLRRRTTRVALQLKGMGVRKVVASLAFYELQQEITGHWFKDGRHSMVYTFPWWRESIYCDEEEDNIITPDIDTSESFEEQRLRHHLQTCLHTVVVNLRATAKRKTAARTHRMTNSFITYSTGCIVEQPAVKVAVSLLSSLVMHVYSVLFMLAVTYHNSNLIHQRHHVLLSSQADTLDTG